MTRNKLYEFSLSQHYKICSHESQNFLHRLQFGDKTQISNGIVVFDKFTLQEHQTIPTNATLSKVSDMVIQWWSMIK